VSIDKDGKDYLLYCDICFKDPVAFDDFDDAVEYKKAKGWKPRKEAGGWLDVCPDCQKEPKQ
jgi:hypothetical protein